MNGQNGQFNSGQQYGQINRPSFFSGRFINNINEVSPQEVPPDGSVAIFVTSDFSSIYTKGWTKDGTIDTKRYVPEQALQAAVIQQGASSESFQNSVLSYLESIERKLGRPYKPYHKPQNQQGRSDG